MSRRRRKIHVATGRDSVELREFCVTAQGVEDHDVVFHLAQCLSFIIQGYDATLLGDRMQVAKNKFAIRKLKSTLKMLDEVFKASED